MCVCLFVWVFLSACLGAQLSDLITLCQASGIMFMKGRTCTLFTHIKLEIHCNSNKWPQWLSG